MKAVKLNWLVALVLLLALLNIVLLAFIWLRKEPRPPMPPPQGDAREQLIQELDLNTTQVHQFDSLRHIHFNQVNQYKETMRGLKDELFNRLKTGAAPDSTAAAIGALQTKIETATFQHFYALRTICTPAQQQKFDAVIQQVLRNMAPRGEGPSPR